MSTEKPTDIAAARFLLATLPDDQLRAASGGWFDELEAARAEIARLRAGIKQIRDCRIGIDNWVAGICNAALAEPPHVARGVPGCCAPKGE